MNAPRLGAAPSSRRRPIFFWTRFPESSAGAPIRQGGARVLRLGCVVLPLALVHVPTVVFAQEPIRNQTVFERTRPEFAPIGLTADGFQVFPQLVVAESYDDNIRAQADDPADDFITEVTAGLTVNSDWTNHALGAVVFGRVTRFLENSEEDTEEGGVETFGRLDITRNNSLSGHALYRRETEDRTDPEEGGRDQPSELDRWLGQVVYRHQVGRIQFAADAQAQRIDFVTPGDDERDRIEYRLAPRISYEVTPSFNPFVEVTYSHQDYDTLQGGVDRDSDGTGAFVGVDLDLTGILAAEAFIGYFRTTFDDPSLDAVAGIGGGAALTWLATDLTSVEVALARGEQQTTRASASSRIRTTAELRLEHELLRNVLLEGELLYIQDDFQGISRVDDIWGVLVGANYLLNRYAAVSLSYRYLGRDSDVETADFDKNVILLSTRFQF